MTNATLTLTNGAAVGMFGARTANYGLAIGQGAALVSQGAPNAPNWIALYNMVQEQPTKGWCPPTNGLVRPSPGPKRQSRHLLPVHRLVGAGAGRARLLCPDQHRPLHLQGLRVPWGPTPFLLADRQPDQLPARTGVAPISNPTTPT